MENVEFEMLPEHEAEIYLTKAQFLIDNGYSDQSDVYILAKEIYEKEQICL